MSGASVLPSRPRVVIDRRGTYIRGAVKRLVVDVGCLADGSSVALPCAPPQGCGSTNRGSSPLRPELDVKHTLLVLAFVATAFGARPGPAFSQVPPRPTRYSIKVPVRIQDGQFVPKLRGAIGCCCCLPPNDLAESWPLTPREWSDAFGRARFNLTHIRMGPFSDQGYGWGMLDRVRANVQYANAHGLYVEVDLVDSWALVNREPNLYNDTCDLTHNVPPVHYRQFVRQIVKKTGDLHVLYNLGNEGWRCQPSRAWEDELNTLVKVSLHDFGYPDRPVGSTYNLNQTSSPTRRFYDYVAQHGFGLQQPVVAPDGRRVPSILNESDNVPHTVQDWRALVTATEAQAGTYVAIWRGPMSDADWNTLLVSYGGGPVQYLPGQSASACLLETRPCSPRPSVPPEPAQESDPETRPRVTDRTKYDFPRPPPPLDVTSVCYMPGPDHNDTTWELHSAATERLLQEQPWLFRGANDPSATFLQTCDAPHRITFFSLLQAELQPRCVEVGDPFKEWNARDSVDLSRCPASHPQGCVYEGRHNIIFGGCRVVRFDQLRNVYRGTVTRAVTEE